MVMGHGGMDDPRSVAESRGGVHASAAATGLPAVLCIAAMECLPPHRLHILGGLRSLIRWMMYGGSGPYTGRAIGTHLIAVAISSRLARVAGRKCRVRPGAYQRRRPPPAISAAAQATHVHLLEAPSAEYRMTAPRFAPAMTEMS